MSSKFFDNIFAKSPWGDGNDNDDFKPEENIFTRPRKKQNKNPFDDFNFNLDFPPKLIYLILGALVTVWLLSGIYEVREGEQAVIMRFGKFVRKGSPGLNYRAPSPIENVIVEKVNQSRRIEIGYRSSGTRNGSSQIRDISAENIMLTGDENIVYLNADIMWHIKDLEDYIFNVVNPEDSVKTAAESAIREEIGQIPISSVLSSRKQEIADRIEVLTQKILDQYGAGVQVNQVQLLKAEPPPAVIDAYRDVQTSKADKEREINQAQSYSNDILPKARGRGAKLLEESEGYKREMISKAEGDTKRFNAVLEQYQKAKQVTKDRVYLETMLEVMKGAHKIVTDSNVLPHMAIKAQKD